MPLAERSALLEMLDDLVAEARAGRGGIVCLAGEAGVGKSALAEALAERVRDRVRVLWGACEDLSTPEALGPLYDLVGPEVGAEIGLPGASSQLGLFHNLLGYFATEPTLVVLEDAHWADDATLALIRFTGRRVAGKPVLLLVTARNDTADERARLRRALVDVPPDAIVRIDVPPLSKKAVHALARESGQNAERVFALTGGNAFMLTEVLRSGGDATPANVRDALLRRADKLSPLARQALDAVSVFTRQVDLKMLRHVCAAADESRLEECAAAGLLTVDTDHCAFRHEIARHVIEQALSPSVRMELNRSAMQAFQDRTPDAAAKIVHHAVMARDAEAVLALAPRAAEAAARNGAHRQAAEHYETALTWGTQLADEARADLLEKSGFELQMTGRIPDAISRFREALALRESLGDMLAAGNNLRWIARLTYNAGDREEAIRFGLQAIAVLEPHGPGPELANAYANLALIKSLMDDPEAAPWADKAIGLASELSRRDILADALTARFVTKQWRDVEGARADYEQSLSVALELGRDELVARAYTNFSCIEFNVRDNLRAHAVLQTGMAYCKDRDLDFWFSYMRGVLAQLHLREGRWDEARDNAIRTVESAVSPVWRFEGALALYLYYVRTGQGDPAPLYPDITFDFEPQRLLAFAPVLGEEAWVYERRREETLPLLQQAQEIAEKVGNVWAAGQIAYWRRKLGAAAPSPASLPVPYALQFAGEWEAAAEAWARQPAPFDQALALLEGDADGCRRGMDMLIALGAEPAAQRFRLHLRQRGVRGLARGPRSSTRANPLELTGRQQDVLALIERGLPNAKIAARLNLSVKTVDHHVSAILSKLGVATRQQAAARARQLGAAEKDEGPTANIDFWVRTRNGALRVALHAVSWFSVDGDYVVLHSDDGDFLLHESLARIETRIPQRDFIRVHRSAIVRKAAIIGVERLPGGALQVKLKDGKNVRVSRPYQRAVSRLLSAASGRRSAE